MTSSLPTPDAESLKLATIADHISKAEKTVQALCNGGRWTMSVPARLNEDPDLVISTALADARSLLSRLAAVECALTDSRDALEEAEARNAHMLAEVTRACDTGMRMELPAREIVGRIRQALGATRALTQAEQSRTRHALRSPSQSCSATPSSRSKTPTATWRRVEFRVDRIEEIRARLAAAGPLERTTNFFGNPSLTTPADCARGFVYIATNQQP